MVAVTKTKLELVQMLPGPYDSRLLPCDSFERSEVRVSILPPRFVSSRRRAKRAGLI